MTTMLSLLCGFTYSGLAGSGMGIPDAGSSAHVALHPIVGHLAPRVEHEAMAPRPRRR